jgi:hypothetical protein
VLILLLAWHGRVLLRSLAVAYTVAMSFLLVYYGEHYVLDELAGTLLAIGGWRLAGYWQDAWAPAIKSRLRQAAAKIPPAPAVPGRSAGVAAGEPAGD